nr:uncharacterized protein LOC121830204 isoform X4 [Peromyscus maniculatus bairdii]
MRPSGSAYRSRAKPRVGWESWSGNLQEPAPPSSGISETAAWEALLAATKIWNLVSWPCDECTYSPGICFKLSIKISTVLEKKTVDPPPGEDGLLEPLPGCQ